MSSSSPSKKNIYSFNAVLKEAWEKAAGLEWESAPLSKKSTLLRHGLEIKPYYDKSDLPQGTPYQLPSSTQEFSGARAWVNMPLISVAADKPANQTARDWLNSGADGILFEIMGPSNPEILLNGIELPYCNVSFLTPDSQEIFFKEFASLAIKKKTDLRTVRGAIFWKNLPAQPTALIRLFKDWSEFHPLGIIGAEDSNSPTAEIADLLAKAVKQINFLVEDGLEIKEAVHALTLSISIGVDFFMTIAKLKVLRMLWFQIANSYVPGYSGHISIHATIKSLNLKDYEPHSNLLTATTTAMSAILGGSDSITLQTLDPSDGKMSRITRNISSILREESHLSVVSDPTAGAYYLESLIDQMAQEAWKQFQQQL